MGLIKKPLPVKLFTGVIFKDPACYKAAVAALQKRFGAVDLESPIFQFNFTDYYEKELGAGLLRRFISFGRLIDPSMLAEIKLFTNRLERKLAGPDKRRRINLDPGYLTEASLILATTKPFSHRIYLNRGIYAEVTLTFAKGAFRPQDWTYPDYRTPGYQNFFKQARDAYALKIWKKRKNTGG